MLAVETCSLDSLIYSFTIKHFYRLHQHLWGLFFLLSEDKSEIDLLSVRGPLHSSRVGDWNEGWQNWYLHMYHTHNHAMSTIPIPLLILIIMRKLQRHLSPPSSSTSPFIIIRVLSKHLTNVVHLGLQVNDLLSSPRHCSQVSWEFFHPQQFLYITVLYWHIRRKNKTECQQDNGTKHISIFMIVSRMFNTCHPAVFLYLPV